MRFKQTKFTSDPSKRDLSSRHGHQLTPAPVLIPGVGNIQINLSLWDEEVASPNALQDKWRETATAAIIAGLTSLSPGVGAAAASLEAAKGIVTDASRDLIAAVSDFLGIADDHIATHELSITRRLSEKTDCG